jgi:hypothetical protein
MAAMSSTKNALTRARAVMNTMKAILRARMPNNRYRDAKRIRFSSKQ